MTPTELAEIENNTSEYVGYAGIAVDQLIEALRQAWSENEALREDLEEERRNGWSGGR